MAFASSTSRSQRIGLHALVVEPDPRSGEFARKMLECEGYAVTVEPASAGALRHVHRRGYDLLLADADLRWWKASLARWLVMCHPESMVVATGRDVAFTSWFMRRQVAVANKPLDQRSLGAALARAREQVEERRALKRELDARPSVAAILTPETRVWLVNEAWAGFAIGNDYAGGFFGRGLRYDSVCRRALHSAEARDAKQAMDRLRAAAMGVSLDPFSYPCHGPDEERWFEMRCEPMRADAGLQLVSHRRVG